jgi:hypothetical protein
LNRPTHLQEGDFELKTGLEALRDPEDLIEIDDHYLEEMEEKRQLLQRKRSDVFSSTPEVYLFPETLDLWR